MTTRREVLSGALAGGAALVASSGLRAQPRAKPSRSLADARKPGEHVVKPLPFDPKKLVGLTPRLLVSHHDNNYAGAVKNLNRVEAELASVTKDTPGLVVSALKERELLFANSKTLHELYFGNLGGGGKAGGAVANALAKTYGSFSAFEEQMRRTAMSLAGGSGWVVLGVNLHDGRLQTSWSGNHKEALAFSAPLLVLDMYEHSYALDFGAGAARYVEAFFKNVAWDEVERRYERARSAYATLAG